jgi:cytochrome c oxidase subunit 2
MDPRSVFGQIFPIEVLIAAIVFALVCLAILTALWVSRRRKRAGREPTKAAENNLLEIGYAVAVAAVAGFVVYLSLHSTNRETAAADPRPAAVVDITGFQWCWRFDYPGQHVRVTGTCQDFGDRPTMVIPAGVPVTIRTRSTDVIHSWWVPALRYKLDAFPHHTNTATFTVDKVGEWAGRCAEFCGDYHYTMDFRLRAVSMDDYTHWLAGAASASS